MHIWLKVYAAETQPLLFMQAPEEHKQEIVLMNEIISTKRKWRNPTLLLKKIHDASSTILMTSSDRVTGLSRNLYSKEI